MQKFDRVFHRQDMVVTLLVDLVDHGGKRRRLTRTGRTGHQHKSGGACRKFGQDLRQAQFLKRLDFERDDTERQSHAATLQIGIRTETREVRNAERKVTFLVLFKRLFLQLVHQAVSHTHGFVRFQFIRPNGREFTRKTNQRRGTGRNMQVRSPSFHHFR